MRSLVFRLRPLDSRLRGNDGALSRLNETQGGFADSFSELFDDDSNAALYPQLAGGMATVDRNFQQTSTADQGERRTRLDILVCAAKFS